MSNGFFDWHILSAGRSTPPTSDTPLHLRTPARHGDGPLIGRTRRGGYGQRRHFFPDAGIVPAQFSPARREAGEMECIGRLMTAILVDALQCYQTGRRQAVKRVKAFLLHQCMHRTWTIAGPHKEAAARQRYASVRGRQTRDDQACGNTDTQDSRGARKSRRSSKGERGIRLWIQSVTSLTATIRQFPIFRKRTLYSRGGGPF